jgi:prepilin-type N-terminal cleavage/methylation domain-containing protein
MTRIKRITRIKKETTKFISGKQKKIIHEISSMNVLTEHFGFAHSNPQSGFAKRLRRDRSAIPTGPRVRNLSAGFTLVELMVSITILTAIILIVSTLLSNAQRAVNLSQSTITADADARAVTGRIRADLAALTTEGFLAIYTDTNDRQHLVFTAVGSYKSMTEAVDPVVANAARIDYGRTGDSDKNVLWRRAVLLNGESGQPATTRGDMEEISLADYKVWNRTEIDDSLYNAVGNYTWEAKTFNCFVTPPVITLPPNSLADLDDLWPYLVRPCTNLQIEWTDGELDTNEMLLWYNSVAPKAPAWTGRDAAHQDNNPGDNDAMEYDAGGSRYCALWTYAKKDNWPLALRITFTMGTGDTAQTYEVIVDLPR